MIRSPEKPRVVIFASGPLGRQVADFALGYDRSSVSGIVTLSGDPHTEGLDAELSRDCVVHYDATRTDSTASLIKGLGGNIFVLAWWPILLPALFLELGQRTTLNLHPSLLPFGRGKDPNFWALVEQSPFGVTMHHVTSAIDGGDIAFQREISYGWADNGKTLYESALREMFSLFCESYPRILCFDIPQVPQQAAKARVHYRRELDKSSQIVIDESYTARQLFNLLRARTFEPHPACRFVDDGATYEVRISISKVEE
jgi:methionyl-tRNA formyltransferase